MCRAFHKLDNVVAIVDYNRIQLDGFVKDIMELAPLADKWRGFGWHAIEIDGHDIAAFQKAFARSRGHQGQAHLHRRPHHQRQRRFLHGKQSQVPRHGAHADEVALALQELAIMPRKTKFELKLGAATREAFGRAGGTGPREQGHRGLRRGSFAIHHDHLFRQGVSRAVLSLRHRRGQHGGDRRRAGARRERSRSSPASRPS